MILNAAFDIITLAVLLLLLLYALIGYYGSNLVVGKHPEWRRVAATPQDFGLEGEKVSFESMDGLKLSAWWFSPSSSPKGTVILAHGAGGNKSSCLSRAAFLERLGYSVLAVDLRAHGESAGNYMTPGYYEAYDVLGAARYAISKGAPRPVVAFGHSYGAVACLHAAADSRVFEAVISDSAFISIVDLTRRQIAQAKRDPNLPRGLGLGLALASLPMGDKAAGLFYYLRTRKRIDAKKATALSAVSRLGELPVLFIAGERDPIAPPQNTQTMFQASRSPAKTMFVVPGAGHSTYAPGLESYESKVSEFLSRLPRGQPGPGG